jgi:hypothetical protein
MSKKVLSVSVKGKEHTWSFNFDGDLKDLEEWRKDGLVIDVIENTCPLWIQQRNLHRLWFMLQDLINFKNPIIR